MTPTPRPVTLFRHESPSVYRAPPSGLAAAASLLKEDDGRILKEDDGTILLE